MENILYRYLPVVIMCIGFMFQYHIFVTPEMLEVKHREILTEISKNYSTKEQYDELRSQLSAMQLKIDKIYDVIIGGK